MKNLKVKAIETNAIDKLYEISKIIEDGDILVVSSLDRYNIQYKTSRGLFASLYKKLVNGENYEQVWMEIKNRFDKTLKISDVKFNLTPFYLEIENTFKTPDKNYLISRADFLTSLVISKIFNLSFIDSKEVIKFNKNTLNLNKSKSLIKKMITSNVCLSNNYGEDERNNIILTANNLNSSVIANALKAQKLDVFTSDDAITISNRPNSLRRAENLSYKSAKRFYNFGGQTFLSEESLNLLEKQKIPAFVKNIYLPVNQSIISSKGCEKDITCLAGVENCVTVKLQDSKLESGQKEMLIEVMKSNRFKLINNFKDGSLLFVSNNFKAEWLVKAKTELEKIFSNIKIFKTSKVSLLIDSDSKKAKNNIMRILENENISPTNVKLLKNQIDIVVPSDVFNKLMNVLEIYAITNSYRLS